MTYYSFKQRPDNLYLFLQVHMVRCMKSLQTLPWWHEKNPFIRVGANTADAKTHNLTQYRCSHSKWWHGNAMVNPDWGPSAGFPLPPYPVSVHCLPETSPLKLTRLQRLAPESPRETRARCRCGLHRIYSPTGLLVLHDSARVCLRQEVSVCCVEIRMQGNHTHLLTQT